ncbi:ribonuclease HI family protein [bacterium]|nr:ribonuclease HI family protein [bacterium]
MNSNDPQTLTDLLRALERSGDLRTLARECGLSVRELRRRLAIWRRELQAEHEPEESAVADPRAPGPILVPAPVWREDPDDAEPTPVVEAGGDRFPPLVAASSLLRSPLPSRGRYVLEIFTDGASRGNPGPAAIGIVFRRKGAEALAEHCEAIGRATNNVAEYRAVVTALEFCQRWGVRRVHLKMDSELIVRQLHGTYRVKSPELRPLYQQVVFLSRSLAEFEVAHVRREHNAHADALANRALDG